MGTVDLMAALGNVSFCFWDGLPPCPTCRANHGDPACTPEHDRALRTPCPCGKGIALFVVAGTPCCAECLPRTVVRAMERLSDFHVGVWSLCGWLKHYGSL